MIIEVRAKNVFSFTDQIALSMKADMRNKSLQQTYTEKITLIF